MTTQASSFYTYCVLVVIKDYESAFDAVWMPWFIQIPYMISLADLQPLKTNLLLSTTGFYAERYFSDKIHASLIEDYIAWRRQFL